MNLDCPDEQVVDSLKNLITCLEKGSMKILDVSINRELDESWQDGCFVGIPNGRKVITIVVQEVKDN